MNLLYPSINSQRTATTLGTSFPTLLKWCVGYLTSNMELMDMEGICTMGPKVYSPYPRRLESLTICWCYYKGTTFSCYFKTLSVGPAGFKLTTSCMAARCSTKLSTGARCTHFHPFCLQEICHLTC